MLTFELHELLIVIVAALFLFSGLCYLALRRRDEILEVYLASDEPDIEREFFKKKPPATPETVENEPEPEESVEEEVGWGIPVDEVTNE